MIPKYNLNTDIADPCLGRGGPESPVHFRNPESDRAEQQGLGDGADSEGSQVRTDILGGKVYTIWEPGFQTFLFAKECIPNFFYIILKCYLKQLSSEWQFIGKCFALTLQLRFQQLTRDRLPDAGGAEEAACAAGLGPGQQEAEQDKDAQPQARGHRLDTGEAFMSSCCVSGLELYRVVSCLPFIFVLSSYSNLQVYCPSQAQSPHTLWPKAYYNGLCTVGTTNY